MTTVTQHAVAIGPERIDARFHRAQTSEATAPCVVLAHGIGATQDCGLDGFATAFADAGLHAVTFDYRHFGGSTGQPRQVVSPAEQVADYHCVIDWVRGRPGVDPDRIIVWGVSFSGGHVIEVAARDERLCAAIALTPAVDGLAVVRDMIGRQPLSYFTALTWLAVRDVLAARRRRTPVTAAIVAPPGRPAALNAPGVAEAMLALAGPSWRNEFAARLFLSVATFRPAKLANKLACPALFQIGDLDSCAPPGAATRAAEAARASVHHYPCDHFDVYPGAAWHQRVVADQVAFLRRVALSEETA